MNEFDSGLHKGRFFILFAAFVFFWGALEANLLRFQVFEHERLSQNAKRQYEEEISLEAQRGIIYDRNGYKLATNILYYDIAVDPLKIKNKSFIAKTLAQNFPRSQNYYLKKINRKSRFAYLERRTTARSVKPLLAFNDPGLIRLENFGRHYPYGNYGSQLLGFTDPDDNGLSGIELQLDAQLKGVDGKAVLQYDAVRGVGFNADYPVLSPKAGNDIVLTIDKDVQTIAERALKKGVDANRAVSGMVVVMDPHSGAVLAMANYPSYNPNQHKKYKSWLKKNRTITDVFEPGSTMKMFTAGAILQERLHKPEDIVFCENGRYKVYNHYIRDTKKMGWLTFENVIAKSSNIGMVKLVENMPSTTLFKYLKNFGFGSKSEIGLIGEASGSLANPSTWSGLSKAEISFGQEVGVTALQVTAAFSALVNGGYLMRPYVISQVVNPLTNTEIERVEPERIRQVLSPEVCTILKGFMHNVVKDGTGMPAAVENIEVGGKTGTAQKFDPKSGRYTPGKYVASFVGFAPIEKPKYVVAVFIDEPQKQYYGGPVAGPVFSEIVEKVMPIDVPAKVQSRNDIYAEKTDNMPSLNGFTLKPAMHYLKEKDFDVQLQGKGSLIKEVELSGDLAIVSTQSARIETNKMPNLKGMTLRQALSKINFSLLAVKIEGEGVVLKQSIKAGTVLKGRNTLKLSLK